MHVQSKRPLTISIVSTDPAGAWLAIVQTSGAGGTLAGARQLAPMRACKGARELLLNSCKSCYSVRVVTPRNNRVTSGASSDEAQE